MTTAALAPKSKIRTNTAANLRTFEEDIFAYDPAMASRTP